MLCTLLGQIDTKLNWDEVLAPHVYVFYVAFIIAFLFTPVMRSIAMYYGIIDQPDQLRKTHTAPVAYLGGVAVFMGWVAGLAFSQIHLVGTDMGTFPHVEVKISIVVGACVIVLLGLVDDTRGVKPLVKIACQVLAALLLLNEGVGVRCMEPILDPLAQRLHTAGFMAVPMQTWFVHGVSSLVVVAMVVGCCNATNLMDGLDGLCGGVTAVIAIGFLFLAVHLATSALDIHWDAVRIVLALSLLGAVLGFIPYNFNPASIFMGDTGSMFIGYAIATMILLLAQQQSKWFLAAMVMFALPVMDTLLAFARRWVNRRPIFSADRHHFHHQLVARGLSVRQTVLVSYALAIAFVVLGALIVYMRTRYAGAFYLVIFGSIIVAAYKMGMVHETPRVVTRKSLAAAAMSSAPRPIASDTVLEVRESDLSAVISSVSEEHEEFEKEKV